MSNRWGLSTKQFVVFLYHFLLALKNTADLKGIQRVEIDFWGRGGADTQASCHIIQRLHMLMKKWWNKKVDVRKEPPRLHSRMCLDPKIIPKTVRRQRGWGSWYSNRFFNNNNSNNNNERYIYIYIWSNYSDLTRPKNPNGGELWRKWDPLFQGNLGWWNIIIWPDIYIYINLIF